jgi:tryptophan synthase alpha chain
VIEAVTRIKRHTNLPIAVGFGLKTPEARARNRIGRRRRVVGSALVEAVRLTLDEKARAAKTVKAVTDLVSALAAKASVRRAARPRNKRFLRPRRHPI